MDEAGPLVGPSEPTAFQMLSEDQQYMGSGEQSKKPI